MIVLIILLENPGGLPYSQLLSHAQKKGIKNKTRFSRILKRLTKPPWSLVERDASGNYTLGIVDPIARILKSGEFDAIEQVSEFLNLLYNVYEKSEKKQNDLFYHLVADYIISRVNQLSLITSFLTVFFYDRKIRELWLEGQRKIFDMAYEKRFEITEKFFKIRPSDTITDEELNERVILPIKKQMEGIEILNRRIIDNIEKINTENDTKLKLEGYLKTEPLLKVLSEEPKGIIKFINSVKELK